MIRIGTRVFDKLTNHTAFVEAACQSDIEGKMVAFYQLDETVPVTEDYPTRWRHAGEVVKAA